MSTPQVVGVSPLSYGAVWNGSSNPVGTVLGSSYNSPSALAGYTNPAGAHPYIWATNPIFGIAPFTLNTSTATTSGSVLAFNGTVNSSGTSAFAQCPFVGQAVTGTNIPAGTTVASVAVVSDFQALVTLSNPVTGSGVTVGESVQFAMTSAQILAIEMDWLGLTAAIYSVCLAAGGWGRSVLIPTGMGVMGNTAFSGMEIVVPVYLLTGAYWEDGAGVQLIGQGMSTSVVSFPQDLGAGRFAVKVDPEHVIAGVAGHQLIDLAIIGSPGGIGQASFGLPRYLMSGVMLLHKTRVTRSDVSGFFASAYVSTDHNYVSDSNLKSSGYAVYFGYSSTGGNGNTYVENVDCGNSLIGAIGIAWNNWASDCVFRNFAGDQFATFIYKENQGTNTATDPLLVNCVFDSCATEGISSSIFYDYNAVNHANYSGGVYSCVFINCLFSITGGANWRLSATTSYFPSTTVYAAYDIGSMSENRWILGQVASSYDYSIVTLGIIRAPGGCNGNAYEGCGVWLVYATAAVPSYVNNVSYDTWDYQGVSGSVAIWLSGSDTVGAIVTNQNNYGILQPMANSFITGQSLSPALGVLMAPVSKSCGVAYATGGPVTVLCNASAGLQTGQAAYVDHATPGQANSASGNSGNARQYLGSVISAQSGTTAVVMWGPGPVI